MNDAYSGLYRKKPIVIEAWQFARHSPAPYPQWLKEAIDCGAVWFREPGRVFVHTSEGVMEAASGAWIIRGVKGELYPCAEDIFAATYDAL